MSEIENKLDEDYLFYLGFTTSFFHRLPEAGDISKCQAWLEKLCGTPCIGVDQKRHRNIFLSNLVLCMQEGKLTGPFIENPHEIDLSQTSKYFGEMKFDVQTPDWLDEMVSGGDTGGDDGMAENVRKDGRTYVATRAMPGGQGAFAYVAVSLGEQEPKWLGGGEGVFEEQMQQKFRQYVPEPTEMEKILARRKDPKERERVITFYDILIQNINDELDGELQSENNETVNGLLDQMVNDLKNKGQYGPFQFLPEKKRRTELLLMLHDRVFSRRDKVKKREEVLDNLEASLPKSFFDASISQQDKYELPSIMWEQAINKAPARKHLTKLQERYPEVLNRKFLRLLANQKEEMALRMQRRHDGIVSQMKKELRVEGEKLVKWVEEARVACDRALDVLKAVHAARKSQIESELKLKRKKGGETEKTLLYEQMRHALYDQQQNVENEAEVGRALTDEINHLNAQTEMMHQVTNESILQKEETNMALMKNIKKLRMAVEQNEGRLMQLQTMTLVREKTQKKAEEMQEFFVF